MTEELKPCPFCGGGAVKHYDKEAGVDVYCQSCEAGINWRDTRSDAITAWNARATPKVKPLVWEYTPTGPYTGETWRSGQYWIGHGMKHFMVTGFPEFVGKVYVDISDAFAAAQAHRTDRILSALE